MFVGEDARIGFVERPMDPPISRPSAVYAATAKMYFSFGVKPVT